GGAAILRVAAAALRFGPFGGGAGGGPRVAAKRGDIGDVQGRMRQRRAAAASSYGSSGSGTASVHCGLPWK
ncbi:unnamed protein product, partial [Urochloa humidicola]